MNSLNSFELLGNLWLHIVTFKKDALRADRGEFTPVTLAKAPDNVLIMNLASPRDGEANRQDVVKTNIQVLLVKLFFWDDFVA